MSSTVPSVRKRLLEKFAAATEADKTEVWPDRTNEEHQREENVYLGAARGTRDFKTMGPGVPARQRQESYELMVEVEVFRSGTDQEGTEGRLWQIVQALELSLAEDKTLTGVAGVQWVIPRQFSQSTKAVQEGVLAHIEFGVYVEARI